MQVVWEDRKEVIKAPFVLETYNKYVKYILLLKKFYPKSIIMNREIVEPLLTSFNDGPLDPLYDIGIAYHFPNKQKETLFRNLNILAPQLIEKFVVKYNAEKIPIYIQGSLVRDLYSNAVQVIKSGFKYIKMEFFRYQIVKDEFSPIVNNCNFTYELSKNLKCTISNEEFNQLIAMCSSFDKNASNNILNTIVENRKQLIKDFRGGPFLCDLYILCSEPYLYLHLQETWNKYVKITPLVQLDDLKKLDFEYLKYFAEESLEWLEKYGLLEILSEYRSKKVLIFYYYEFEHLIEKYPVLLKSLTSPKPSLNYFKNLLGYFKLANKYKIKIPQEYLDSYINHCSSTDEEKTYLRYYAYKYLGGSKHEDVNYGEMIEFLEQFSPLEFITLEG